MFKMPVRACMCYHVQTRAINHPCQVSLPQPPQLLVVQRSSRTWLSRGDGHAGGTSSPGPFPKERNRKDKNVQVQMAKNNLLMWLLKSNQNVSHWSSCNSGFTWSTAAAQQNVRTLGSWWWKLTERWVQKTLQDSSAPKWQLHDEQ
jgi:hypothetical protein